MAFDQTTRSLLQRTVAACRNILAGRWDHPYEGEFTLQLQQIYGIHPDGSVAPLEAVAHLSDEELETARTLRQTIDHYAAGLVAQGRPESTARGEAVARVVREQAFTVLNRLAALRLSEERGIVLECVRQGMLSEGFQLFQQSVDSALGTTFETYQTYLSLLFDELSTELGVLFDRSDPHGLLFPRQAALEAVLSELNGTGRANRGNDPFTPARFAAIWREDETLGWIYQYYNDPAERAELRATKQGGSDAPRNNRELAVRNQFFTPRYVVEFLTDNSLGRLWYEMTKGRTQLATRCRYLIRRANEVFLGHPDLIDHLEQAAPWVREVVATANFTRLPENPPVQELSDLALAIDGYAEWERRGGSWDHFVENFYNPQAEAAARSGAAWRGDAFELWSALFAYQRAFLRHGHSPVGTLALEDATLQHLWPALRDAVQHPTTGLSQEELLRQPVFIPHRPIKDPREIRIIDPACGSMHFGLYAFDLLELIYAEAFAAHSEVGTGALRDRSGIAMLSEVASDLADFEREVPRLIIERNLHGIDIDPRAAQIAGLSLWLRAQRAWERQGVPVQERPLLRRANIVCAEPMPGEEGLLREFVEQQFSAGEREVFFRLLNAVFERMKIAGEAGSLLQIEEDIRSALAEAKSQWTDRPRVEQTNLFEEDRPAERQAELSLDLVGISDEEFWGRAEERIYDALRAFAERADSSYRRRLFVDDAARGFAFIDLCRQRYDVALMNPPFGDASLPSKPYIEETYGDTKGDVYKAFVECFQTRLVPAGYLGIISSRTGFFLGQSEDWRTRVVLRLFRPIALADLGMGVLDAMVEVAAYVLRSLSASESRDLTLSLVPALHNVAHDRQGRFSLPKWQAARDGLKRHQAVAELEHLEIHGFVQRSPGEIVRYAPLWNEVKKASAQREPGYPSFVCLRALTENDKGDTIARAISSGILARNDRLESKDATISDSVLAEHLRPESYRFEIDPSLFRNLPGSPLSYWVPAKVVALFGHPEKFESAARVIRTTNNFGDNSRFVRLRIEVPSGVGWRPWVKGSTRCFFSDVDHVVAWDLQRNSYKGFLGTLHRPMERPASVNLFEKPGITWPLRARTLCPSALPQGCVFSVRSFMLSAPAEDLKWLLSLMSSRIVDYLAKVLLGRWEFPEFIVTVIQQLPFPPFVSDETLVQLTDAATQAWMHQYSIGVCRETSHAFTLPAPLCSGGVSLQERIALWQEKVRIAEASLLRIQTKIDEACFALYGLDEADRRVIEQSMGESTPSDHVSSDVVGDDLDDVPATLGSQSLTALLISWVVGVSFGRWDIRYATKELPGPEPPDPFAPLTVSPPGMLQNDAGLPAAAGDVSADYPVQITWHGILVDDPAHPEDVERRTREVFAVLFPGRADAIADEACALLGVKSIREWFRKPSGFFADHLKHYSKPPRQAPIYWPLSTASGSYTLWLYYHRLTPDTLFKCLQDFVEPKLRDVENAIARLRAMEAADESGARERKQLEEAEVFRTELLVFRDELALWAPRWKPNLNDGVQITASPLWKLFRLPKWQKFLETTWRDLDREAYEWAHLAHTLYPDRVRKKCENDRSLAIAHGLEELCKVEAPKPKSRRGKAKTQAAEDGGEE